MAIHTHAQREITEALMRAGCGILRRRVPVAAPTVGDGAAAKPTRPSGPGSGPALPSAVDVVRHIIKDETHEPKLHALATAVALRTGLDRVEMVSPRRAPRLVRGRMIYYWIAKDLTSKSLVAIGRACGGRDHATVIHGIRTVEQGRDDFEPELSDLLSAFERRGE